MLKFLRRLWFWIRRRQLERELEEEARLHLDSMAEDAIAHGVTAGEARRAARLEFGNPTVARERSRQSWGFPLLESILQDMRFAARQLRKNPGFTVAAVLTLALGIGANVAIFSAVYSVLLRPLPFDNSDRLLIVRKQNKPRNWDRNAISAPEFLAWRSQTHSFDDMAVYTQHSCVITGAGDPEEDPCEIVSSNLFSILRVTPILGRGFSLDDDVPGKTRLAVLSHALWQRRFAADPHVVGRSFQLDGSLATVIGVMPGDFSHLYASPYSSVPALWLSGIELAKAGLWNNFVGIARLKPHAAPSQAQAEMDAVSSSLEQSYPDLAGWRAQLMTLRDYSGDTRLALLVLMSAVTFVLLIACANVANLLLARGAGRAGEFAVRKALGAGQARLIRQLLTESLLISLTGGALGILLASFGVRGLAALAPAELLKSAPGLAIAPIEWRVLLFASALALVTTMLFAIAPAVQSTRITIANAMKESNRALADTARSRRFRSGLVISEIALALVLLVAAGLMIRTLSRLMRVNLGFNPQNVLTMHVPLQGERYKHQQAIVDFWRSLTAQIENLPGVESASVAWGVPLYDWNGLTFVTDEQPVSAAGQTPDANYLAIGPNYFQTLELPILKGRAFTSQDGESGQPVAIINYELARRYWPGQDPIGKRLRVEPRLDYTRWLVVVGVAGNVLTRGPEAGFNPEIYVPYNQLPWTLSPPKKLIVRTKTSLLREDVAQQLVQAVHRVDKDQPVSELLSMDEIAQDARSSQRMMMALLGSFAALALLLSLVGIYSVLAYSVAQRTREIGLRMALGAGRADVTRFILGNGLRMAILGIVAGFGAGLLLTRLMTGLLYDVRSTDPVTFLAVITLLSITSLAACYVPARRAARVDPIEALRRE